LAVTFVAILGRLYFYIILIMEVWKKIPGFENYEVSNLGNVKSFKYGKERILKNRINKDGYYRINLSNKGEKQKTFQLHQLVAIAFLNHKPNGNNGLVVDHINNIKTDNRLENLQLITNRENSSKDIKNTSSKYTGVYWHKKAKKWSSQIKINGKNKHLGYFKNPKIASAVYLYALENL
jgi:hypothetical protein